MRSLRRLRWTQWRLPTKLLLFYMPLILLPIVIGMVAVSGQYSQASKLQMKDHTERLLSIVMERLDRQMIRFEELSLEFFINKTIHELLEYEASGFYERVQIQRQLDQEVNKVLAGPERQYITNVIVFSNEGVQYVVGSRASIEVDPLLLERITDAEGGAVWEASRSQDVIFKDKIVMGRSINELERFSRVGQVLFIIEPQAFYSIWEETVKEDDIVYTITTGGGDLFLADGRMDALAGGRFLTIPVRSGQYDLVMDANVPLQYLDQVDRRTRILTVTATAVCVLFGLIVTRILATDMIAPIRKLMLNMKRGVMGVDPKQLERVPGAKEIRELNDTFISVMYEIQYLNSEMIKTNQRKQDAQIRALINQLSPHFLYNTLNTIRWMAMIHQQYNIRDMCDSLINLLAYSFRDVHTPVPLRQEVEILHDYVQIQKARFQHFTLTTDIEEDCYDVPILKFMLQPLVENAIIHGLETMSGEGMIQVSARLQDHKLIMTVTDNGVGMSEQRLQEIRGIIEGRIEGNQVGLRNIQERVQLFYGKTYGIHIESEPGNGTKVTMTLPNDVKEGDAG